MGNFYTLSPYLDCVLAHQEDPFVEISDTGVRDWLRDIGLSAAKAKKAVQMLKDPEVLPVDAMSWISTSSNGLPLEEYYDTETLYTNTQDPYEAEETLIFDRELGQYLLTSLRAWKTLWTARQRGCVV